MKKTTKKKLISVFIISAFLFSSFAYALSFSFSSTNNDSDVWAAGISVVIFGSQQPIPAGLGVNDDNTYDKLYTLSNDNIIYKSTDESVMVKDFFEIWGENFNSTCIMNYCNNNQSSMVMYVNGVLNTDYELYTIQNRDVIIIDYR
ncbi:MAG: hypothetical protein JW700_00985 [Candidatus Aenigmarchaeota archaeon]|nr:hypothetical protein [Candidatus Aenigmarchaeota archaeon]